MNRLHFKSADSRKIPPQPTNLFNEFLDNSHQRISYTINIKSIGVQKFLCFSI